jgi:diacylglycerol kinase (ATP)
MIGRMSTHELPPTPATPALPKRTGLSRLLHAGGHSWQGLVYGWHEPAFRQECLVAVVAVPAAFWLGQSWLETVLLLAVLFAVMVVELLNTAIESAIDRVGPEWHALSKRAKDLGSGAVLISLLFCGAVWVSALWRFWAA